MLSNIETVDLKNTKPAVISLLSDVGSPVTLFARLTKDDKAAFLFESAEGDSRLARYSFAGCDPKITVSFKNGVASLCNCDDDTVKELKVDNPVELLRSLLDQYRPDKVADLPKFPFTGGLVGYLGYGATGYFDGVGKQKQDPYNVPDGFFGLYDSFLVFDHEAGKIYMVSYRGQAHAEALLARILQPVSLKPIFAPAGDLSLDEIFEGINGSHGKDEFVAMVKKAKEFVYEGQVFQIVVSQRFSQDLEASAFDVYRFLRSVSPSPYAYFLKCPDFAYLGCSPETFVKVSDGKVVFRALAGTRPRGANEQEDARLACELRENEKELAEHRMLVDLGRNDLGRNCAIGSVTYGEIATVTKLSNVMHLSTEITGQLKEGRDCFDVFQGCFPQGTVSGAPKIRAMELLCQLEPEQRGIYAGTVGYFDFAGNADGAIAIRSALLKDGNAHVNAGAGIVFDSDAEAEYEETRNKAKSVLKAIKLANANVLAEERLCR
jgi:anthranilate synthase component 1